MNRQIRPYSVLILITVSVFFIFMLNIFVNSFAADYRIALRDTASYYSSGSLMPLFHLGSELTGEVGVILRFAGACCLLAFSVKLVLKRAFSISLLRKAILLEGIYYLFNLPFIIYLFVRPYSISNYGAGSSYLAQILFVTPIFIIFYLKLKNETLSKEELAKWGALAIIGFIFALWIKHFLFAIYALPLNFSNLSFSLGFLNSTLAFLIAGIMIIAVFMPLYKKKSILFNTRAFGAALIVAGLYACVFAGISIFNIEYLRWINLIDWWTISLVILGIGFLGVKRKNETPVISGLP